MKAVVGIVVILLISLSSLFAGVENIELSHRVFRYSEMYRDVAEVQFSIHLPEADTRTDNSSDSLKITPEKLRKKKITAAILAFPLPFGVLGLHRVYLGTKPYVPAVYIGTLGGCFGVLPFIDFVVILMDKNPERFLNNPKVFMWNK